MSKSWNPHVDMPDLHGKVAVVTGANSGIGLETVKHLSLRGAKIYFTARSASKADATREHVLKHNPRLQKQDLIWLSMELSDVKTIQDAVEELKKKESKVDILINNAGLIAKRPETTEAGWEYSLAVCYIGHFIFTNGLIPLLKAAAADPNADVRVVNVSSEASHTMFGPKYPWDFTSPRTLTDTVPYEPWVWRYVIRHLVYVEMIPYGKTKMAINVSTRELQRRFDEQKIPIICTAINPGAVNTGEDTMAIFVPLIRPIVRRCVMISPDKGAFNSLFAATAREVRLEAEEYKGQYIEPVGKRLVPHQVLEDEKQLRGLWDLTTKDVDDYLVSRGFSKLFQW